MTVNNWHTYFDILCDKYGSPYFTDAEKDLLFNRAQLRFVDEVIKAAETDDNVLNKIHTLIFKGTSLLMDSNGDITYANINSNTGTTMYKMLSVYETGVGYVSQASHNLSGPAKTNSFKNTRRRFVQLSNKFNFFPVSTTAPIVFTVVGYPTEVVKPGTSSNLPDLCHNEIISIAVDLAGIATREEALAQLNQLNK